jgi:DNA-directed RNA polymerase subunit omega
MRQYRSRIRKGKCRNISVAHCLPSRILRALRNPPAPPMRADLVEQAAQIIKDPPILINMVSKRVRQIAQGRAPLVERRPGLREADLALLEIIQGKITVQNIDGN